MHATGVARFGDRASERPRALAQREEFIRGKVSTENCLNCGEVLTGQHCSHCGQRATVRVLSLWGMLRDVLGDMTNFDSRLWRTLVPLAFRPGLLTQDFLRGRRASYTPPFRMYLILSVAFFLLAQLGNDPGGDLKFNVDEKGGANLQLVPGDGDETATTEAKDAAAKSKPGSKAGEVAPPASRAHGAGEAAGRHAREAPARGRAGEGAAGNGDQARAGVAQGSRRGREDAEGPLRRGDAEGGHSGRRARSTRRGCATRAARSSPTRRATAGRCSRTSRR